MAGDLHSIALSSPPRFLQKTISFPPRNIAKHLQMVAISHPRTFFYRLCIISLCGTNTMVKTALIYVSVC